MAGGILEGIPKEITGRTLQAVPQQILEEFLENMLQKFNERTLLEKFMTKF